MLEFGALEAMAVEAGFPTSGVSRPVSAGYRRELAFFIYLSLIGSYLWADQSSALDTGQVVFKETTAYSGTASLDCAFFWNSSFYLAYAWDSRVIRSGQAGGGLLLTWNKLF